MAQFAGLDVSVKETSVCVVSKRCPQTTAVHGMSSPTALAG